ncbi:MAG: hypothetical protein QM692_18100 [Thermomicrobiales bacterium]
MHLSASGLAGTLMAQRSRRALAGLLGVAGASLAGAATTVAKKPKKAKLCLNGQTVSASKKKKKKLVKQGATPGACPDTCTPQCDGVSCGDDGCGGTCACAPGTVCDSGVCQACTVSCTGTATDCGNSLKTALSTGGTIYACPGRYGGNFTIANARLVGAGATDDATTSTILDARGSGIVVSVTGTAPVTLANLQITGGSQEGSLGSGVSSAAADLRIEGCVIKQNKGGGVGALNLVMRATTVTKNTTINSGGGVQLNGNHCTITDSVISFNKAGGVGGGISLYGTLSMSGTRVEDNESGSGGGGISIYDSDLTLDNTCQITRNKAGSAGGGIFKPNNQYSRVTVGGAAITLNTPDNCANFAC